MSEVVDISPGNLGSSLWFIQSAFHIIHSAYKLNKQGDIIQPWHTPFPIWNQSVVPCPVLTVASWPAYRFLKRQVRWSGIPISFKNFPQFVVIHTVKGFGIVNKAEVDVFLELSCFFNDPEDVGNLIPGFSAFSKACLNIWKFLVHILLKPSLENFEHYFASVKWVQLCGTLNILWNCLSLGLEWKLTFIMCKFYQFCVYIGLFLKNVLFHVLPSILHSLD